MARYYADKNIRVSPDRIFLTSGTSEAYTFLFRLLGNAGDRVLAPRPGYPLFDYLLELNDLKLCRYPLGYDGRWRLEEKALANLSASDPKALLWIHPNNPTGNFATAGEVEILNRFSVKNTCPLIVDEVFFDFAQDDGLKKYGFAGNSQTLTFTLSGISKILGLPQMKLSWIVVSGPPALCEEACRRLEVIADTYLSVNTPVQHALPSWLEHRQTAISEILSRVRGNYAKLAEAVRAHSKVQVLNMEGGWYAVLRLQGETDEEACLRLLKERDILAHPGYLFDFDEEDFLVVSLLLPGDPYGQGLF